jgi:hypothetical protein
MSETFKDWENDIPPRYWKRILAMDVGGATANVLEWAALCPETQSLVFYDEVHKVTTDMSEVAKLALPKMKPEGSQNEYEFIAKAGDYENKIALDDMARHGIRFTNAVKQNKIFSVHRFAGYLHPNPKRPYPSWHPMAGQYGAPLFFSTPRCKHLNDEIPQQKWKNEAKGTSVKDELDRTVKHDAVDCALYIARIMPAPITIPILVPKIQTETRSLQSQIYWENVRMQEERKSNVQSRTPYTPGHVGGNDQWRSLLGF